MSLCIMRCVGVFVAAQSRGACSTTYLVGADVYSVLVTECILTCALIFRLRSLPVSSGVIHTCSHTACQQPTRAYVQTHSGCVHAGLRLTHVRTRRVVVSGWVDCVCHTCLATHTRQPSHTSSWMNFLCCPCRHPYARVSACECVAYVDVCFAFGRWLSDCVPLSSVSLSGFRQAIRVACDGCPQGMQRSIGRSLKVGGDVLCLPV